MQKSFSNPMSPEEIKAFKPYGIVGPEFQEDAVIRARVRTEEAGLWRANQVMGRKYPIGCVALEITQRCNLDCTLCYLSENSESVKDIPLEEVFRRMDQIRNHYGPHTDVQITGGDPTLRKREELIQIVRRVRSLGMKPTLMTNGIKATRDLLLELVDAGLNDVAFHVDTTQERRGYTNEVSLNELREKYIERARGLPINVIFNTTVYAGNFHEIPALIKFFRKHTDTVGFASFQLQADTGRGELRKRGDLITIDSVKAQIQKGADANITFGTAQIGHQDCNVYASTVAINGNLYDMLDSKEFIDYAFTHVQDLNWDRNNLPKTLFNFAKIILSKPELTKLAAKAYLPKVWKMKADLVKAKGKINRLTILMHNFMDASQLDGCRIHACSFMVMTPNGPISMCMHNAKRDEFILQPVKVDQGTKVWDPLTGTASAEISAEAHRAATQNAAQTVLAGSK